jgi:phosphoglycolate phosphatase-like HAD superfamily hydrolase
MMNLAVFDLDGTLLQTSGVDDECYAQAVEELFGIRGMSTDWGAYSDSTDAGILDDLLRLHRGRAMSDADRLAQQARFVELLAAQALAAPHRFAQTAGAATMLGSLPAMGWTHALATGGWKRSALLKLEVAGLDLNGAAAAFADDDRSREGIILKAVERAMELLTAPADEGSLPGPSGRAQAARGNAKGAADPRVVYVGDGVWDIRAARRLGIGFVGVARGARAESLRVEGAPVVIDDFRDVQEVLRLLDAALPARP